MDRALGARTDKSSAAFESIFGRPSAAHHQYPRPPPSSSSSSYAQGYHRPPEYTAQNYYYQQRSYDPRYDGQHAGYSQAMQAQYSQQAYAPSSYRQQPYYVQQQQPQMHMQYQQQQVQYPAYNQAYYQRPMQPDQYAQSLASSSHSTGVIMPQPPPQETADPNIEAMVRSGMTPAQAYQAQVYSDAPVTRGSPGLTPGKPVSPSPSESRPHHGVQNPAPASGSKQVPVLGFEPPDTRLDLDFLNERNSEGRKDASEESGSGRGVGLSGSSYVLVLQAVY